MSPDVKPAYNFGGYEGERTKIIATRGPPRAQNPTIAGKRLWEGYEGVRERKELRQGGPRAPTPRITRKRPWEGDEGCTNEENCD